MFKSVAMVIPKIELTFFVQGNLTLSTQSLLCSEWFYYFELSSTKVKSYYFAILHLYNIMYETNIHWTFGNIYYLCLYKIF